MGYVPPQVHPSQESSPQSKAAPGKTLTQAEAIGAQTASEEKPKVMLRVSLPNSKTDKILSALALRASLTECLQCLSAASEAFQIQETSGCSSRQVASQPGSTCCLANRHSVQTPLCPSHTLSRLVPTLNSAAPVFPAEHPRATRSALHTQHSACLPHIPTCAGEFRGGMQ